MFNISILYIESPVVRDIDSDDDKETEDKESDKRGKTQRMIY